MPTHFSCRFAFTAFLSHDPQEPQYDEKVHNYLVFGREQTKDGLEHWQGYVEFHREWINQYHITHPRLKYRDISATLGLSNKTHLERARYDAFANSKYCKKANQFKTFGEPVKQGKRTDLDAMARSILSGKKRTREIAEENPSVWVRNHRAMDRLQSMADAKLERKDVHILWYHGPPGTGKSVSIRKLYPNAYKYLFDGWWDGYDGQDTVIIDECTPDMFNATHKPSFWNTLIQDGEPYRAGTKGSHAQIVATKFIMISNFTPQQCVARLSPVQQEAFLRRIRKIHPVVSPPKISSSQTVVEPVSF